MSTIKKWFDKVVDWFFGKMIEWIFSSSSKRVEVFGNRRVLKLGSRVFSMEEETAIAKPNRKQWAEIMASSALMLGQSAVVFRRSGGFYVSHSSVQAMNQDIIVERDPFLVVSGNKKFESMIHIGIDPMRKDIVDWFMSKEMDGYWKHTVEKIEGKGGGK